MVAFAGADGVALPVDVTLGVGAARGRVTGVRPRHTLVLLADVALAAVGVSLALVGAPGDGVRLGDVVRQAAADGVAVTGDSALSVWAAGRRIAGVWLDDTSLALADVSLLAIGVAHTLRPTSSDGVGLGDKSWLAATDGVAIEV